MKHKHAISWQLTITLVLLAMTVKPTTRAQQTHPGEPYIDPPYVIKPKGQFHINREFATTVINFYPCDLNCAIRYMQHQVDTLGKECDDMEEEYKREDKELEQYWISVIGDFYLMNGTYTKYQARKLCESHGGTLPEIRTRQQAEYMAAQMAGIKMAPANIYYNQETATWIYPSDGTNIQDNPFSHVYVEKNEGLHNDFDTEKKKVGDISYYEAQDRGIYTDIYETFYFKPTSNQSIIAPLFIPSAFSHKDYSWGHQKGKITEKYHVICQNACMHPKLDKKLRVAKCRQQHAEAKDALISRIQEFDEIAPPNLPYQPDYEYVKLFGPEWDTSTSAVQDLTIDAANKFRYNDNYVSLMYRENLDAFCRLHIQQKQKINNGTLSNREKRGVTFVANAAGLAVATIISFYEYYQKRKENNAKKALAFTDTIPDSEPQMRHITDQIMKQHKILRELEHRQDMLEQDMTLLKLHTKIEAANDFLITTIQQLRNIHLYNLDIPPSSIITQSHFNTITNLIRKHTNIKMTSNIQETEIYTSNSYSHYSMVIRIPSQEKANEVEIYELSALPYFDYESNQRIQPTITSEYVAYYNKIDNGFVKLTSMEAQACMSGKRCTSSFAKTDAEEATCEVAARLTPRKGSDHEVHFDKLKCPYKVLSHNESVYIQAENKIFYSVVGQKQSNIICAYGNHYHDQPAIEHIGVMTIPALCHARIDGRELKSLYNLKNLRQAIPSKRIIPETYNKMTEQIPVPSNSNHSTFLPGIVALVIMALFIIGGAISMRLNRSPPDTNVQSLLWRLTHTRQNNENTYNMPEDASDDYEETGFVDTSNSQPGKHIIDIQPTGNLRKAMRESYPNVTMPNETNERPLQEPRLPNYAMMPLELNSGNIRRDMAEIQQQLNQ